MIVCVCRRVSDRDIARLARAGCSSFDELQLETGCGTQCGRCLSHAQACFGEHMACPGVAPAPGHVWPLRAQPAPA